MTPADLKFIQSLLLRRAGNIVWSEKRYLVERRLDELAHETGLRDADAVIARVRTGDPDLEAHLVESMLTGETHFFRDRRPFEQFETVLLPALIADRARSKRLRVWCCAVSTGQEAYSLAMVLARHREALAGWSVDIVGSDLSRPAIERARAGRYDHFEVQRGLPIAELIAHFTRDGEDWVISDTLRRAVQFEVVNVAHEIAGGVFDVIFCRNLLLYLDTPVKRALLDRLAGVLAADGALVLGATESVIGLTSRLVPDPANPGLYRPVPARPPVLAPPPRTAVA